jgi:predicted amidophosphoribosyltransferase
VTVVPSSQGRTPPLADVLGRRISLTRGRFAETLVARSGNTREMRSDHCEVVADVRGKRIPLIDDTWTTGASLQSAAVALKRAGAARVVGLVIGRHHDESAPATSIPFDWTVCVRCQQG